MDVATENMAKSATRRMVHGASGMRVQSSSSSPPPTTTTTTRRSSSNVLLHSRAAAPFNFQILCRPCCCVLPPG